MPGFPVHQEFSRQELASTREKACVATKTQHNNGKEKKIEKKKRKEKGRKMLSETSLFVHIILLR